MSARQEVYVMPLPATGERIQVSVAGGVSPRWRDDGRELFFLDPDGRLMAARITYANERLEFARPVALFESPLDEVADNLDHFAPCPGGKTFLFRVPVSQPEGRSTILVNWFQ